MASLHEALRGVFAWEREVKASAAQTTSEAGSGAVPAAGGAAGGASWWEAQADAGEASVFETAWKDMPPVREPIHVRVTHSEPKKERTVPRRSGGLVSTGNTKFAPKGGAAAGKKNLADKIDEAAAAAAAVKQEAQQKHAQQGGGGGGGGRGVGAGGSGAALGKEAAKKMKMGAQEYYKAWDKFDADAELQRLDGGTADGAQPPGVVAEQARQAALLKKTDGNAQFKRGNYKEAVALYTQAIALDPSNAVLWQNRAAANLKLRRHAEVEKDCNEAIARNAQAHKAFHRRGVARAAMHNYAEAISDFERVLQIEPKAQESRNELAKLKEELEKRVFGSAGSSAASARAPAARGRVSSGNRTVQGGVTIEELPDGDDAPSPLIQVVGEASAPAPSARAHAPAPTRTTMKKRHVPQAPVLQHTLPDAPPNSAFEFETQWGQFHTDLVTLGEWLKRIEPSALPRLLGESADEEMLLSLFHAMRKRFFPHDGDRCYQMLQAMCTIPRFDLIMGMMESEDVVVLDRLFTQLMGYTSLRYGVDDVNKLSRRYGVKEDIMMRDPVQ